MTTPILVIGDTFKRAATLKSGDPSGAYDVSAASAIYAAIVSADHTERLCSPVALSDSDDGSSWAAGVIVISIPKATTAEITSPILLTAKIEIQVTIAGEDYTWFGAVKLVPGHI